MSNLHERSIMLGLCDCLGVFLFQRWIFVPCTRNRFGYLPQKITFWSSSFWFVVIPLRVAHLFRFVNVHSRCSYSNGDAQWLEAHRELLR